MGGSFGYRGQTKTAYGPQATINRKTQKYKRDEYGQKTGKLKSINGQSFIFPRPLDGFILTLMLFLVSKYVSKYRQKRVQSRRISRIGLVFRLVLTCAAFCVLVTAGGKNLSDEKETTVPTVAERGFLWKPVSNMQKDGGMIFHFFCDGGGRQPQVILKAEGLPDFVSGVSAILRTAVGNPPPSGKGYKKFIYTGKFSKEGKKLLISGRLARRLNRELHILHRQISENQKMAETEYQERINYCKSLPNPRRQKCYQSSSGYQPVRPLMLLTVTVEEGGQSKDFFALFDPNLLKNLKLSCFDKPDLI